MKKFNFLTNRHLLEKTQDIPIFFACDNNYVKFMMVTMHSVIAHASSHYNYKFYVLHRDISESNQQKVMKMMTDNVSVEFCDVTMELKKVENKLSIRDYYSLTTYYRMFIADMFPEYDKVLYLDSDTIAVKDVAELFRINLAENYIGAIQDHLVCSVDLYGEYTEKVLGVSRVAYFNAGIVLINCKKFRSEHIKNKFIELLNTYSFVVAQDQDYLNLLCQDNVHWINAKWNVQMTEEKVRDVEDIGIVHYNLAEKPWQNKQCRYADLFWEHAKETADYSELCKVLEAFGEEDANRVREAGRNLMHLAQEEIYNDQNYYKLYGEHGEHQLSRQEILIKREEFEKAGRFDEDLEQDPPGRMLMPNEVDYLRNNMTNRLTTKYAFRIARWFMGILIRKKQLVVKEVRGKENFKSLKGGAVITCNHFNAMDSFAMQIAYETGAPRTITYNRKKLFRVIREGNYTSFPGFFGFLMRNCNTLPLSSNKDTMKKFMKAVDKILQKGHYILVYPEQSLWWNYRKPKPVKKGAYTFAAKNNVPVLPMFITMEDTEVAGEGGFPVQAYTIHILKPIYPNPQLSTGANVEMMMRENAKAWKAVYEETYGIPLEYSCDDSFVSMYK